MMEKYKSKTKNFITLYARKFIIWLIMAFVLFSFSQELALIYKGILVS